MPQTSDLPDIPHFDVEPDPAGGYIASRRADLTMYQRDYGCRSRVTAATFPELELLCTAERLKAELVALAEMSVHGF